MKPLRRESLNGLLVLVIASLLSVAFSTFQVTFNALLWVLILMGIAIAVSGYILFEITLRVITSAENRETEWLKRVGTPARIVTRQEGESGVSSGLAVLADILKDMTPAVITPSCSMVGSEGGSATPFGKEGQATREKGFNLILAEGARSLGARDTIEIKA